LCFDHGVDQQPVREHTAELIVAAVRCQILSPSSALALASQNPVPDARIDVLLMLASAVDQSAQTRVIGEALSVARSIDDAEFRGEALAKVAKRLPQEQATAVTLEMEDAWFRAKALADIAIALPAEAALTFAGDIDVVEHRVRVLTDVSRRLPARETRLLC
jgi:hypothetical protein